MWVGVPEAYLSNLNTILKTNLVVLQAKQKFWGPEKI
jgi:hypothetical protein